MPLYILDLIGVFAFSVYGAYIALKKDLDIFGIVVCAFLTALGGGTIRELILNHTPFWFHDYNYIYIVFLGIIFSVATYYHFHKIDKYMLIVDAIGLSTFAFIGSQKAIEVHLGLLGVIFFAVITAVGGGILRDILVREIPQVLYMDFYATPSIILAILYYFLEGQRSNLYTGYILILLVFIMRVIAIYKFKTNIWAPPIKQGKREHIFLKRLQYLSKKFGIS